MPEISIIVPVFNVESYLRKCVDSLINQTFADIEIILVDDGSTDNSANICDEYSLKDKRIKVIHKENGGLSDARNAGLEVCKGEYIGFVDGDDYVSESMYQILYDRAIQFNADVSGCQLVNIFPHKVFKPEKKNVVLHDKVAMIQTIFTIGGSLSVCNKIFKKDVFRDLRFDKGKYYEDAYIVLKWIGQIHCLSIINDGLYFYIHREKSITGSDFSMKSLDIIEAYKYDLKIIENSYPAAAPYGELRLWWAYRNSLENILRSKKTSGTEHIYKNLRSVLLKNIFRILKNPVIPMKQKLAYILIICNSKVYMKIKGK